MWSKVGLALVIGLTGVALPAFADDSCVAPTAPLPVDGAAASQTQILAAIDAAKDYIARSDIYQNCLSDYIDGQKADAAKSKTMFDPVLEKAELAKGAASQDMKQKVGDQINAAIFNYKKTHNAN
jgi:hypothetical protein